MCNFSAVVHKDGRLVIPKKLRDEMGIGAGTKISLELNGDAIFLTPISTSRLLEAREPIGADASVANLIPHDERTIPR
jgi:AbrB family looped-hinge helix DNA binding protein